MINSRPITYAPTPTLRQISAARVQLDYVLDTALGANAIFTITIDRESDDALSLSYSVVGLTESPDNFGLHFAAIENLERYLRSGYTSWDGAYYVDPEARHRAGIEREEVGFAMTQLLPRFGEGSLVLGFERHDRFQHTFQFAGSGGSSLEILTWWDRKSVDPSNLSEPLQSERLIVFSSDNRDHEAALRRWAERVATCMMGSRPVSSHPIKGWCSWYNLYAYIDERSIVDDLRGAAAVRDREKLPLEVFQIDDGFTPEMGDWLAVKPQFPRGMKPLLDDIRAAGFIPGLWIAPFVVGNRSDLFRQHPDWVVHDALTGKPLAQMKPYGEERWHKQSGEYYILDVTHPDAFDYIRHVFRVWRQDWGCDYFKIDFLFYGAEYGPTRALWHTPGLTRIEVWRRMAEMIREEIGEATWLACGSPLWAAVGLVDGMRIGGDVGVRWTGFLSAESLLRDQATRNFTNGLLWQTDPDCVLLRNEEHYLSDGEVTALALYAGMSGGAILTSDSLHHLSPERIALLRLVLGIGAATSSSSRIRACRNPLLGQSTLFYTRFNPHPMARTDESKSLIITDSSDPIIVQVRDISERLGYGAILIFNTGDYPLQRSYTFEQLGLPAPLYTCPWNGALVIESTPSGVSVQVEAHEAILLFVSRQPFEATPVVMP